MSLLLVSTNGWFGDNVGIDSIATNGWFPLSSVVTPPAVGIGDGGGGGWLPLIRMPVVRTDDDDEELAMLIPLMMKVIINGNS